jgi:hypothetical protein
MGKEILKTPGYIFVIDDSEIKAGDWYVHNQKGFGLRPQACRSVLYLPMDSKKLIAHLPLNDSPSLEGVPLLPPTK